MTLGPALNRGGSESMDSPSALLKNTGSLLLIKVDNMHDTIIHMDRNE